jgi:phenylalanyl-tRNA synthetase alpha chain
LDLDGIVSRALAAFRAAGDAASLENAKAKFVGKQGELTALQGTLKSASPEQRKELGARFNTAKQAIESGLQARRDELANEKLNARLAEEALDVTLPARGRGRGSVHPVIKTWQRIEAIWRTLGFDVADGPEIETDWYNFTALNNPENHPARSMQDTFYVDLKDEHGLPLLLRTHTSPMQVRYARMHKPPIKVIAPGRTYRVDSDATHSPMFHQVECLWIDEDISFADLKGVYTDFLRRFFEDESLEVRFRPSFFPFTEPSAEIDLKFESGTLKGRWLEISGSGQVHPSVVKNFGLDPERYIGFAFGSGIERLTMLRYGIEDLRLFFDGDLRFLAQFE